MIYEPREDSFLLEKFVKEVVSGTVLDIGTGSGIQAQAAQQNGCKVVAADINPEAVVQVKTLGIPAVVSDLFANISQTFDWIIFNPPYLPADEREDAASAQITTGGEKGHELIERFLQEAKDYLNDKGNILVVVSSLTGDVPSLITKYKYACKVLGSEKIPFETLTVCQLQHER